MSRPRVDPFQERTQRRSRTHHVLGSRVRFESESEDLLALANEAFGDLPRHGGARQTPAFMIRLVPVAEGEPVQDTVTLAAGARWLCGSLGESAFAVMSPSDRTAMVGVPRRMLRERYTARYELVEFAALTLLARARALVPLHAAAVVCDGRGVLLLGDSGAGKSTFCLHAMLGGMSLLSEDSVFLSPDARLAAGVPGFLHLRMDGARWLRGVRGAAKPAFIRRRSGVRKLEIDLRRARLPLSASPVPLAAVVKLEARSEERSPLLRPLRRRELLAALDATQPYAASRPEWSKFKQAVARVPAFSLRRAAHPRCAVDALRAAIQEQLP